MLHTVKNTCLKHFRYFNEPVISLGFVRHRTRINDPKPRPSHYLRRVLETATQPFYAHDDTPSYAKCENALKFNHDLDYCVENNVSINLSEVTYENFLAKEMFKIFNTHSTVCFFHFLPYPKHGRFHMTITLRKNKFHMEISNYNVMRKALTGTKFSKVLPLFKTSTNIIHKNELDLIGIENLISSYKYIIPLGGLICGQYISANDLENFLKIKDIETIHSTLSNTLTIMPSKLCSSIVQPMAQLSDTLQQIYAKT